MKKKRRPITVRVRIKQLVNHLKSWTYRDYYACGSVTLLLVTTSYWASLSARINLHNADQLVGQFLFENQITFRGAVFPGAHSFFLKWPIFAATGTNAELISIVTVLLTLVTVGALAYILSRIERRPLVFGTLCLALASTLLLIPTEPYPGALLPLNLAMISTRNIEYIIYIAVLVLIIRTPRLRHGKVILAIIALALLIASDKLFLALTLGGSVLTLGFAYARRHLPARRFAVRWLVVSIGATLLVAIGLWVLTHAGVTTIYSSSQTGPYTAADSFKNIVIGSVYAGMGLLTNFGANPAFDATIIMSIPGAAIRRLLSIEGFAFLVNVATSVLIVIATARLLRHKPKRSHKQPILEIAPLLSLGLFWTTTAATVVFIMSDHYYPVDGRYLTIGMFAGFIILATYLRTLRLTRQQVSLAGLIIALFGVGFGIVFASGEAARSRSAYAQTAGYDTTVAAAIKQHKVTTLIGDYWRVMPIKLQDPAQTVVPLTNCLTPRDVLLSRAWQTDLTKSSFAYILSLKPSVTGFPACTIDQVVATYGRPNSSQLIAGSVSAPEEIVLFYDHGTTLSSDHAPTRKPVTSITPRPISESPRTDCSSGSVIMNIVAHQDDDILFINPDTYHDLRAGSCVRSVYITAGDAGSTPLYWLGREEGSKAAYASMLDLKNPEWISRTIKASDQSFITTAFIKGNSRVSLLFLHLPDGNINGQGFSATHYESLAHLKRGSLSTIHTVDGQSSYSADSLVRTLVSIMDTYRPAEIRTQAMRNLSTKYPDHSDHLATGWFAEQAFGVYREHHPGTAIQHYIGYPVHEWASNVSGDDLTATEAAFFAYAKHDKGTCESVDDCAKTSYQFYLDRQYTD